MKSKATPSLGCIGKMSVEAVILQVDPRLAPAFNYSLEYLLPYSGHL